MAITTTDSIGKARRRDKCVDCGEDAGSGVLRADGSFLCSDCALKRYERAAQASAPADK